MPREDGRGLDETRPITLTRGFARYAEGSCLIQVGETKVICTASVEDKVPPFLKGQDRGWLTAEYAMLPRSTHTRSPRDAGKPNGRGIEIQRLIGRSLRSVVDLDALGERTVTVDCDVLQADGGTRTAAISGAFVAVVEALAWMRDQKQIKTLPFTEWVAAVSVGVVRGEERLDLAYDEDSQASVDMNIVMTDTGRYIEVQGTAEGTPFDRARMNRLLDLAQLGVRQMFAKQREALAGLVWRPAAPEAAMPRPSRLLVAILMALLLLLGPPTRPAGAAPPSPTRPSLERLELVTDQAATGDGGNSWGGHQTRIVRTRDGCIFTAYTAAGDGPLARRWRLAQRTGTGWQVVAEGPSGREPVNLLRGPKDQLLVVGWPDGMPHLWSGGAGAPSRPFLDTVVPGNWERSFWPYNAAGIDADGDTVLLQSGGEKPGEFRWARRSARAGRWQFGVTPLDYRHCYAYVLPGPRGRLTVVATRDVRWETLDYAKPAGAFGYVFNAFGCWRWDDAARPRAETPRVREEPPTPQFPSVFCDAQADAYEDTRGRLHILYWVAGPSTQGVEELHHLLLERGRITHDVRLPSTVGHYCRLVQDRRGRFFLIGADDNGAQLLVTPALSEDGFTLGRTFPLDLGRYHVTYSGLALAVPRGGTPLSDTVDGVFPAADGAAWVYFRLRLPEASPSHPLVQD